VIVIKLTIVERGIDEIVGLITAVELELECLSIYQNDVVAINFLCLHPKIRQRRMANLLIDEITNRLASRGKKNACYTSAIPFHDAFASYSYLCRFIDTKRMAKLLLFKGSSAEEYALRLGYEYKQNEVELLKVDETLATECLKLIHDDEKVRLSVRRIHRVVDIVDQGSGFRSMCWKRDGVLCGLCSFYEIDVCSTKDTETARIAYVHYIGATSNDDLLCTWQAAVRYADTIGIAALYASPAQVPDYIQQSILMKETQARVHYMFFNLSLPRLEASVVSIVLP
jgi:hypothetical protein